MRLLYRLLVVGLAGVVVVLMCVTPSSGVSPGPARAADEPPTLEEDYAYPGADKIFADYGVKLISGDGHILFADCATPPTGPIGFIQVSSPGIGIGGKGLICFRVTAPTGRLAVKIPAVFEIRGDGREAGKGHKLRAELTTDDGQHTTVDVDPSGSTQVGTGSNPSNPPTTLLELNASS
ncbi:hypothetical protein ACFWY9_44390 [Amycolatopsis sp. NPDC059027]|uniref:hypothetical protein n=1 Tax=unclassified Amycolatopsis TaxID=2618356 RepID=UPI00366B9121